MASLHRFQAILTSSPFRFSLVALFFVILYVPYILHGGFIIDDWGVIHLAWATHSFWQNYAGWFPLFSNRPISPLIITATSRLFHSWAPGYIMVNLLLWFSALAITASVFRRYISEQFALLFMLFAGLPTIASTVIFSPIMQETATLSFLLWALSFLWITKYAEKDPGSRSFYFLSFFFILLSLLTYEITLPLFVLSALFPALILKKRLSFISYALRYILPLMVVLILDFLYQKVIMPHFMQVFSRLDPDLNLLHIAALGHIWLNTVVGSSTEKIFSSYSFIGNTFFSRSDLALCSFILLILSASLYLGPKTESPQHSRRLFPLLLLTFCGSFSLYFLSNIKPLIGGYDNRGLSSTWWIIAMLLAFIAALIRRSWLSILIPVSLLTLLFSFTVVRDNYIVSYQIQTHIINDASRLVSEHKASFGAKVIGNVPRYTPNNYNNEEVFNNPWDFGTALNLHTDRGIEDGDTITPAKVAAGQASAIETGVLLDGYWQAEPGNLWYYSFDPRTNTSTIQQITNVDQVKNIISSLQNE